MPRKKLTETISHNTQWQTPPELFLQLDDYFHFKLDAAASEDNALCNKYWTEKENGLIRPWADSTFLNPPYGDHIPAWMRKAKRESQLGKTVVCLIPCRTDTEWYFNNIWYDADIIIFISGRIQFGDEGVIEGSAKFPSAIVVYHLELNKEDRLKFEHRFGRLGRVVFLK